MKVGRFLFNEKVFWGLVEDEEVFVLKVPIFKGAIRTEESFSLGELKILPPVVPGKILGIGLNYKDHAREMEKELPAEPLIFMKPPSAVIGHKDNIQLPEKSKQVDYEGELAVVIKKACKNVTAENADRYILGYTCMNDVTARDFQRLDVQYTRAKGFDTFAPIGPFIETDLDPTGLSIKSYLNDELMQNSNTNEMIFDVYQLVSFISEIMTLMPGDVITTGTPPGVGKLSPGDKISVEIENIGKLTNFVFG